MHKEFLSFDGEAIDQKYVLLANCNNDLLENKDGITTDEALEWLVAINNKYYSRKYINVGFGINYDIEMILRTLPEKNKKEIFYGTKTTYKEYKLVYIPRKFFLIEYRVGAQKRKMYWYDVFSFFQGNFISVIQKQLGLTDDVIEWGKVARKEFSWNDYEMIKKYNYKECVYLSQIMQKLKRHTDKLELNIIHWYGSSALAQATLNKWQAEQEYLYCNEENLRTEVIEAFNYGYFGGRIELLKLGTFPAVYSYDINSAYPTAISLLPKMQYYWKKVTDYDSAPAFTIWKVTYKYDKAYIPVFPHRNADGSIQFRTRGTGYYWKPEIDQAIRLYGRDAIKIEYGFQQSHYSRAEFSKKIARVYDLRRKYKEEQNDLEYVLKIILNSVYGKFAQSVGQAAYRNIAYAGFITSFTRAKLLEYIEVEDLDSIIGFATDCIYATKPLVNIPIGKELGEFTDNGIARATFIMSGLYRLQQNGKDKIAQRGYGNELDFTTLLYQLIDDFEHYTELKKAERIAKVPVRTFIGYKRATTQFDAFGEHYLKFVEYTKDVKPDSLEKRQYNFKNGFNWMNESIDSKPFKGLVTTQSHIYQKSDIETYD